MIGQPVGTLMSCTATRSVRLPVSQTGRRRIRSGAAHFVPSDLPHIAAVVGIKTRSAALAVHFSVRVPQTGTRS